MSDEDTLNLYFGEVRSGVYITNTLHGEDRPKDMAQAWLDGDLMKYEKLLAEHIRRAPRFVSKPVPQARPRGRPRRIDRERVKELHNQGLSMAAIAEVIGCGKTQVFRCLSHMTVVNR